MRTWLRYWGFALMTAGALTMILTLRDIAVHLTGHYDTGAAGMKLVLMRIPQTVGFSLLFTGFAASTILASSSRRDPRWADAAGVIAIAASTGVAVFVLLAYVAPWAHAFVMNSILPDDAVPAIASRSAQLARYQEALAQARTDPELSSERWREASSLGFMYHLPVAAAWLATIHATLGLFVGYWTRSANGRASRIGERWAAGLFLLLSAALTYRAGWTLAIENHVPPTLTLAGLLVIPGTALVVLAWLARAGSASAVAEPSQP